MNRILIFFSLLTFTFGVGAQNIPINHWRSHLPYKDGVHVTEVGTKIYCGTTTGLFYFDKSDNSYPGLSKVDGFSDVFIKTMAYDPGHDMLFIAYQDGNLDILQHGKIYNKTDLVKNNILINSIYIGSNKAYICVKPSFSAPDAIYEFTLDSRMQLGDRYNNNNDNGVSHVTESGRFLYASSASGVKRVPLNSPVKNDPNNWETLTTVPSDNIVDFNGKVYAAFYNGTLKSFDTITKSWTVAHYPKDSNAIPSLEICHGKMIMTTIDSVFEFAADMSYFVCSTISQTDAIMDKEGKLWLSEKNLGMISLDHNCHTDYFQPGGRPSTTIGYTAYGYKGQVWVSTGLIKSNGAPGYTFGFYMCDADGWHNYNPGAHPPGDMIGMAKDTVTNHLWLGSLDTGIVDFDPVSQNVTVYYYGNTNGAMPQPSSVSDVGFDKDGNLWAGIFRGASPYSGNKELIERKKDGTWKAIPPLSNYQVNKLLVDDYGYIWMVDNWDNNGIAIYNPFTNTYATLSATVGSGGLPANKINCIAKDRSGQIWMGTTTGVCVYSDPGLLWGTRKYDVQRPYVSSSNSGYLLAQQNITAIAVDGANRKWFGTSNGAYLFSADGTQQLHQFTTANSPLVSNQINDIGINGETGEVFFVTDKGIVSYRGDATDGADQNHDVFAFPNPVKPGYHGPIAIKGLVTDANVKITDVTGQLVYETTALGGQAIWNGQNFSGRDANSGVYLVFITNTDGTQTMITKIMVIR